jgi:hypothetical protein
MLTKAELLIHHLVAFLLDRAQGGVSRLQVLHDLTLHFYCLDTQVP